jgi:integrase
MQITRRKDGRYQVVVPANESITGKRHANYFKYKSTDREDRDSAEKFIARHEAEHREHGLSAVSAKDRAIMTVIHAKYPEINVLAAMEYYKRTMANIRPMTAKEGAQEYIKRREASTKIVDRTKEDIRHRLGKFVDYFGDTRLDEITAHHVDEFLQTQSDGNRRSFWKALNPFFKHAVLHHWMIKNPLLEFSDEQKPDWSTPSRAVYTPEQYRKLLAAAAITDEYVTRYFVMAGMGFFRPEEMIKQAAGDEVLEWRDIQLDRNLIHVRDGVAKKTGREGGDERYVVIKENETLRLWLRQQMEGQKLSGRVIPFSDTAFREKVNKVHEIAGVPAIPDGWRHSAISYYLAMHEGTQIRQVAEWAGNCEATIRTYYLQVLRKEEGEKWFHEVNQLLKN